MKIMRLPSLGTSEPTMLNHSEIMKNNEVKKVQFGGWTKRSYRHIRKAIKKRVEKDLDIKLGNQVK